MNIDTPILAQNQRMYAMNNGHQPGHVFDREICFCKKCNAPLTFIQPSNSRSIDSIGIGGLSGSICNG